MLDHFLNYLLLLVIVIDVLSEIAYFALGALKKKKRGPIPIDLKDPTLWQRLFARRQQQTVNASDKDFTQLHRVLYGFQDGLA